MNFDNHLEELESITDEDRENALNELLDEAVDSLQVTNSHVITLYTHCLKYMYQKNRQSSSWVTTINTESKIIHKDLKNTNNKNYIQNDKNIETNFSKAVHNAAGEMFGDPRYNKQIRDEYDKAVRLMISCLPEDLKDIARFVDPKTGVKDAFLRRYERSNNPIDSVKNY